MKDNFNMKNSYLMSCVYIVMIFMSLCYFGMNYSIKGTRAGFGGLSGCLAPTINLTFVANYPEGVDEPDKFTKMVCNQYLINEYIYEVPSGYEFIGWDTLIDGSGNRYLNGSIIELDSDKILYAQWNKIVDEDIPSAEPDNSDDSLSSEENDNNILPPTDEDNDSILNGDVGEDSGSGSGGGSGNNNNSNSNQNTNKGDSSSNKKPNNNNESTKVPEKKYYNFKFMNDNKEYASSVCEVLNDGTCLMLIPGISPNKDGYVFSGWSLNKTCPAKEIITKSISVNSSNTYYSCFIKIANNKSGVNFVTVGMTVFAIWVVALTLIYCIIKWYRKKYNSN